jgi:hypothetical protein
MTGKLFRVRFLLHFSGGSYFPYSGDDFGWFMDAITFSETSLAENLASQLLHSTTGSFTPTAGTHLLLIAPVISGIEFPPSCQVFTTSDSPLSTNANLTKLKIKGVQLKPKFKPGKKFYTASTTPSVTSVRLLAEASPKNTKIKINGNKVRSGKWSKPIRLKPTGKTILRIVVTTRDGVKKTYRVTVKRKQAA